MLGTLAIPVLCCPDAGLFLDATTGQRQNCGCFLMEAPLPGFSSLALLRLLRGEGSKLPVIMLATTSNRGIADQLIRAGAVDVIDKPLANGLLLIRLQQLLSYCM